MQFERYPDLVGLRPWLACCQAMRGHGTQAQALLAKLDVVTRQLNAGNAATAANLLRAFVRQVEALMHAVKVSPKFQIVIPKELREKLKLKPKSRVAELGNTLGAVTMTLFYTTDFADRLENEILPALRAGFVVLTDRYIFSIIARAIARGADGVADQHGAIGSEDRERIAHHHRMHVRAVDDHRDPAALQEIGQTPGVTGRLEDHTDLLLLRPRDGVAVLRAHDHEHPERDAREVPGGRKLRPARRVHRERHEVVGRVRAAGQAV